MTNNNGRIAQLEQAERYWESECKRLRSELDRRGLEIERLYDVQCITEEGIEVTRYALEEIIRRCDGDNPFCAEIIGIATDAMKRAGMNPTKWAKELEGVEVEQ